MAKSTPQAINITLNTMVIHEGSSGDVRDSKITHMTLVTQRATRGTMTHCLWCFLKTFKVAYV